jgi:hypothetical protein
MPMPNLIRRRDDNHLLPLLLGTSIVVLLAIVAATIWSRGSLDGRRHPCRVAAPVAGRL